MKRIATESWHRQCLRATRSVAAPRPHVQPHSHRWYSRTPAFQYSATQTRSIRSSSPLPQELSATLASSSAGSDSLDSMPLGDQSPSQTRSAQSAKLAALHARLSLSSRVPLQTLARALVDATAENDPRLNNSSLATLGADLLSYHTAEYLLCHYPRLPTEVLFAAQWAYVGPKALAAIAKEWGVEPVVSPGPEVDPGLLQFTRVPAGNEAESLQRRRQDELEHGGYDVRKGWLQDDSIKNMAQGNRDGGQVGSGRANEEQHYRRGVTSRIVYDDEFGDLRGNKRGASADGTQTTLEDASKTFVRALVGAVYLHSGRNAVKSFHQQHILSRHLDLASLFSFRRPTADLSRLCAREGFELPVARLLSETGRLSRHPVFVVGIYSGQDKLGEAAGASLQEAKVRAAVAALKGWYLYRPIEVTVPSDVEDKRTKWIPNVPDIGEVIT